MQLAFKGIDKSFGSKKVLSDLNLQAQSGRAFGLLGRNGAGKTTSIRILMDVFKPDRGEILLDGAPLHTQGLSLGYLPEEKGLYPKQKILRQLRFLGRLRGLDEKEAKRSALRWLDRLGMSAHAEDKLDTLSKGNQQKIQLAAALLTDPQIVILDEPFSGLDPVNALLLREVVQELVMEGRLVFFSSHQMSYVAEFCEDLAILHQGELVLQGSMQALRDAAPKDQLALRLSSHGQLLAPEAAYQALRQAYNRHQIERDLRSLHVTETELWVHLGAEEDREVFLQNLLSLGLVPEHFALRQPSLEDIFVAHTADAAERAQVQVLRRQQEGAFA